RCVKNKVGAPGRTVELRSRFGHGFDNTWTALHILVDHKLISKNGAWYQFRSDRIPSLGDDKYQGESAVLEKAQYDPEWRTALIAVAQRTLDKQVETE